MKGADRLVEWGLAEVSGEKYAACLTRVGRLIDQYEPAVLVLEDFTGPGSRRAPWIQKLLLAIRRLALARDLMVVRYPRASVRRAFEKEGARIKEEIAAIIAARFPELAAAGPADPQGLDERGPANGDI